MELYPALAFFLYLGLCAATSRSTRDPRCISNKPIVNTRRCSTPSWQFNLIEKKCNETCNKDGPFDSKLACDGYCRSVDVCTAPRAVSSCASDIHPVFYYDPSTRSCLKDMGCIYYGNNFPTIEECQETCMRRRPKPTKPWKCLVFPTQGYPCRWGSGSVRFYYKPHTGQCIPFWYWGCGGTANNFSSYRHCMKHCAKH
ncbi:boophilin-H2-like [Amblyomma americanum]